MDCWKNNKGFSLTELLVVIAIFGILMALTIPQVGRISNTMQIRGAANKLAQDLQNARERAIGRGHQVALVFTATGAFLTGATMYFRPNDTVQVDQQRYDGANLGLRPTNPPNIRPPDGLPSGPPAQGIEFNLNRAVFFPQGSATPGAVYLFKRNIQMAVSVNQNGRVRVWRWDNGWY